MGITFSGPGLEPTWVPTEDDLPYSDDLPMESQRHVLQADLLRIPLVFHWADRQDFFAAVDMFVYFSPNQVRTHDFRGPDVFVVQGVRRRERKSWVVWIEGKAPDVVIELLSDTTAALDKGEKKQVYQDRLRVPEYFWYDPFSGELAGFFLQAGVYQPLTPDAAGRLPSHQLGLTLVRWEGEYEGVPACWLRWATPEGELLPTPEEVAAEEHQRAEEEHQRAEEEHQRAEEERQRAQAAHLTAAQAQQREDEERRRANQAQQRATEAEALLAQSRQQAERLAERLRALGVELDGPEG